MSKYNDTSIKKLVDGINDIYFLPDLQRPFVWGNNSLEFEEKVCSLFDSILRNYPIGTLLFWKVDKQRIEEDGLQLLRFLDNSNREKNDELHSVSPEKDYVLVLDGQQRMTIFNLVFRGVFEDVFRGKKRKRNLYLNLLKSIHDNTEDTNYLYEFKFLDENHGEYFLDEGDTKLWYNVKSIINLNSLSSKRKEIRDNLGLTENEELIEENLEALKNSIINETLSYYEIEKGKTDDEALEIFVRVNSKGMVLSYSDLLFSKITQYWRTDQNPENARDIFYNFLKSDDKLNNKGINRYGEGFKFSNDFILKTSLVLIDGEITYKLKNFNRDNILKIKDNWNKITSSIRTVVEFIAKTGINSDKLLRSNNAIIPLIYYIYKNDLENRAIELNSENYEPMKKYLYIVLLNSVFGGQSDQLLKERRTVIRENLGASFPLQEILKKLGQRKNIRKDAEIIELLDEIKYGTDKSKIILSILYGNEMDNYYQEDHLFPQKKTKKLKDANLVDNVCNIQILKTENQLKNDKDFKLYREEIIKKISDYDKKNFIPNLDDDLKDYTEEYFEIFLQKRKQLIYNKIKDYFRF